VRTYNGNIELDEGITTMNRSRIVTTFVLALVIASLASYLVMKQLNQSGVKANIAVRRVVMAAKDLDVGAKLAEADLRLADWVVGDPPKEAFFKIQDAVGRAVLYPTFKDEIILGNRLASVGAGAGMAAVIPPGMRAVSIRVDDVVAVAGFVGPGTRVDVLMTGVPSAGAQGSEMLTKTILENVQVLAAGQKIQPDAHGTPEKVNVVTLLCTIEDASRLTLGSSEGRLQLVLRNPMDTIKADINKAVGRRTLYGGAPTPAPVRLVVARKAVPPPPPAPPPAIVVAQPAAPVVTFATIEIFSAGKKSTVQLTNPGSDTGVNR
jgi:pilus assembly protein CpaB